MLQPKNWIITIIFVLAPLSSAQKFTQTCSSPSFPSPAPSHPLGIDADCAVIGSGGAEAAQNTAKNTFCASGNPRPVKIADLVNLQNKVQSNPAINFGDEKTDGRKAGPTTNRKPLQTLGEDSLVTFQGFVLIARQEGAESVNCGKGETNEPLFHDIHISLVESAQTTLADECSSVVAEMVPHHRPDSWTQENVQRVADAHRPVRVTGHLLFDSSHVPCAGGQKVRSNPKRVSLWEIHPIYKFEVCANGDCTGAGASWLALDQWVATH